MFLHEREEVLHALLAALSLGVSGQRGDWATNPVGLRVTSAWQGAGSHRTEGGPAAGEMWKEPEGEPPTPTPPRSVPSAFKGLCHLVSVWPAFLV